MNPHQLKSALAASESAQAARRTVADKWARARTAEEWRDMFQPEDVPPIGEHERDGESCRSCLGLWPCSTARGEA